MGWAWLRTDVPRTEQRYLAWHAEKLPRRITATLGALPLRGESFMIMEGNVTDSTFMQSETKTYGKNRIFVGQKGHDCDFHGSLWFYWYDESNQHMTPLCHYLDYRWSEDTYDFNLCWISANEILVSAISTGNNFVHGWAGGYKPADLAPWGTQVYYKLRLTYK